MDCLPEHSDADIGKEPECQIIKVPVNSGEDENNDAEMVEVSELQGSGVVLFAVVVDS